MFFFKEICTLVICFSVFHRGIGDIENRYLLKGKKIVELAFCRVNSNFYRDICNKRTFETKFSLINKPVKTILLKN